MAKLDFNISESADCSGITYTNCSEYCTGTTYVHRWLSAAMDGYPQEIGPVSGTTRPYLFTAKPFSDDGTFHAPYTYAWTFGATTGSSKQFSPSLTINAWNTVVLTITGSDGLASTTNIKVKLDSAGEIEGVVCPILIATPANDTTLTTYLVVDAQMIDTTVDRTTDTLSAGDGGGAVTVLPANYTYAAAGTTYTGTYSFNDVDFAQSHSANYQYRIVSTNTTCTSQLTDTGITSAVLKVTDPDNNSETIDITTLFLESPFTLTQEDDFDELDLSEPGIWKFETIVTKTDGAQYIFAVCKSIVLLCDLECKYSKLLAQRLTNENCKCEEFDLHQLIYIDMLFNALKYHIGCHDTNGINNAIELLDSFLANTNCDC